MFLAQDIKLISEGGSEDWSNTSALLTAISHLSQWNYSYKSPDAGDVSVIQTQQREDGVSLSERHDSHHANKLYVV